MNEIILIKLAEKFLINAHVAFLKPGEIGRREDDRVEIIFAKPETFDPNVVIDLADVRVWVNTITGEVKWVPQM